MKKAIVPNTQQIRFTFEGLEPLTFDAAKVSDANREYSILNGFLHRLGDMAAIPKQDSKGNVVVVTEQMRRDAIAAGIAHYESGTSDWNMKGGGRVAPQNPVILQVAAKFDISYEEASAKIVNDMLAGPDAP